MRNAIGRLPFFFGRESGCAGHMVYQVYAELLGMEPPPPLFMKSKALRQPICSRIGHVLAGLSRIDHFL